jgi:hypothetical protein
MRTLVVLDTQQAMLAIGARVESVEGLITSTPSRPDHERWHCLFK